MYRRSKGRPVRLASHRLATLIVGFLGSGLVCLLGSAGPSAAGPYTDPGYSAGSMVDWGTAVDEVIRGPLDIDKPGLGTVSFGTAQNVIGTATGNPLDTLSLGDGGSITVYLESGIGNGPGDDFAVYENGFFDLNGLFAELAYVEVASNGVDFARFDSDTTNPFLVWSFDSLDPTEYHGLAGRHEAGLGTGFDLEDLSLDPLVISGAINLYDVQYVRLVDVVGDGSTVDSTGNPIYDPYATPYDAGGFDLEAVGVIHVPEPEFFVGLLTGILGLVLLVGVFRFAGFAGFVHGRPSNRIRATLLSSSLALMTFAMPAGALTATFDDLGLGTESTLNGSTLSGGYTSGGLFFENNYTAAFDSFTGFAASTTTDTTTPGFENQFSNITGAGADGSAGFGLAFLDGRIVLPELEIVLGAEFTNTTYAALSMLNGDAFAKQFGGASGDDPDFFRLLIEGIDSVGASTGFVELMLADYRFSDNGLDFVLDQWVFLDLTSLGLVKELRFSFESSDVGSFGINTPVYFAIDNLTTVPEPGTALLLGLGLVWVASGRRTNR